MSDRWWETETAWFSFHVPERRLGGLAVHDVPAQHRHRRRRGRGCGTTPRGCRGTSPTALTSPPLAAPRRTSTCATPRCRPASRSTSSSRRSVYDLGYVDGDRLQLRPALRRRDGARAAAAVGSTFGSAHHFDQFGRVTGDVVLHGERIAVDCIAMRDRTWGPRPETRPRQAAYVTGAAGRRRTASSPSPTPRSDGDDPIAYGFLRRDGETVGLAGGTRTVERDDEHGLDPAASSIDGHRRRRARRCARSATPVSRMIINRHTFIDINSLVRWDLDGVEALGRGPGHVAGPHLRRPPAGAPTPVDDA